MTTTATATRPKTSLMTADELLAMPDDGFRYELVRGELRKMSPGNHYHGECALAIGSSLRVFVRANRLGRAYGAETGFRMARDHVLAPDAAFVRAERAATVRRDTPGFFPGHPDLAVEFISPHDRYREVDEKTAEWLAVGALAVIVVNPRNMTVRIHRPHGDVVVLSADDVLEVQDVVPGWRMPVSEIFE